MGAVDHEDFTLTLGAKQLTGGLDGLSVKVGATSSTTEDDIAILVTLGGCDGVQALLGGTHEVVAGAHRLEGVDGRTDRSIGGILESNREGQTGSQLTVQLGLSGTSTNSTNTDQISGVLRGDCVQHLASNRDTQVSDVAQQLAGNADSLVDVVRVIDVGVVDQSLPADSGTGLLEVSPHHNAELIAELTGQIAQERGIFDGGFGVMETARANNNEHAVGLAANDLTSFDTAVQHGKEGVRGEADFILDQLRRGEGRVFLNCREQYVRQWASSRKSTWGLHTSHILSHPLTEEVNVGSIQDGRGGGDARHVGL